MNKNTFFVLLLICAVGLSCNRLSEKSANTENPQNAANAEKPKETANANSNPVEKNIDKGDFKVGVAPAKDAKNQRAEEAAQDSKEILQPIADDLNKTFALPYDIFINLEECGESNAFYDPEKKELIMCYELIDDFYTAFKSEYKKKEELDQAVDDAIAFTFFHELGHALIDVWDLPTTGKEEDAVDQLSTLVLLDGTPEGEKMAINGALSFGLFDDGDENGKLPFWDEHSFNQQRFYNILCLTYGSNPKDNERLVGKEGLPEERAERCADEFSRADKAWNKILEPYLKK